MATKYLEESPRNYLRRLVPPEGTVRCDIARLTGTIMLRAA
jgi:hypothetical protein